MFAGKAPLSPEMELKGRTLEWMKNRFGGGKGSGGSSPFTTPQPGIDTSGIWSPDQIQQRVNASTANTDRAAATQIRGQQQSAGAKGFGTQSPLVAALQQQALGQAAGTNAEQDNSIRWNAAEGNRKMVLDAEKARLDAWAQAQNARNQWWNIQSGRDNALIAAMAGIL